MCGEGLTTPHTPGVPGCYPWEGALPTTLTACCGPHTALGHQERARSSPLSWRCPHGCHLPPSHGALSDECEAEQKSGH